MCLWDNLGNSTDLHWEASIGQVSLLLILNLLCNDNLSLLRMPSGRAGLGLTRRTAVLMEVEMYLLVDFFTHDSPQGYAFFETSTMPETIATNSVSAMMESPLLSSTGSQVTTTTTR